MNVSAALGFVGGTTTDPELRADGRSVCVAVRNPTGREVSARPIKISGDILPARCRSMRAPHFIQVGYFAADVVLTGLPSINWSKLAHIRRIGARLQGAKSFIINFSAGNIAGMPLCCQQRTGACTRLEQGVPFFVRAPQRYTSSSTVGDGAFFISVRLSPDWAPVGIVFLAGLPKSKRGESARRSIVSGGGVGRRLRPAT